MISVSDWFVKEMISWSGSNSTIKYYTLIGDYAERGFKPGSHITVKVPTVPAVVPGTLPGTCPRQTFFNGNTCPRYPADSLPAVPGELS